MRNNPRPEGAVEGAAASAQGGNVASALYRVWEGDAAQYLDGISYAASSAPAAPVASILLDAFDNAGETPKHLLSENFLRSCPTRSRPAA